VSVILADNLSKRYGQRVGIDAVSLGVPAGLIFGFLGPNGAGKTTLIRLLLGFLRANRGSAAIKGMDCWKDSHRIKRRVGYLPGDLRLYPWMTATNAVALSGRIRRQDLTSAGQDLADRFDLDRRVPVRRMSRGMRQKLGLILALTHDPEILILDEPTSGLDPLMRDELSRCLRQRAADGRTVFFSSHTLSEVENLCDRVAIISKGRIVADESLDTLRARARRQVVLHFQDRDSAACAQPPAFLDVIERRGAQWRCEIDGPARALVAWAADQSIVDLTVGPPDLETIFRRFYADEDDAR